MCFWGITSNLKGRRWAIGVEDTGFLWKRKEKQQRRVFTAHFAPPPLSGIFHTSVNALRGTRDDSFNTQTHTHTHNRNIPHNRCLHKDRKLCFQAGVGCDQPMASAALERIQFAKWNFWGENWLNIYQTKALITKWAHMNSQPPQSY